MSKFSNFKKLMNMHPREKIVLKSTLRDNHLQHYLNDSPFFAAKYPNSDAVTKIITRQS